MIKNYIFDFGGVLYEISQEETYKAFVRKSNAPETIPALKELYAGHSIFDDFEKGMIIASDFRKYLIENYRLNINELEFDEIWNKTLIGMRKDAVKTVNYYKNKGNVALLSNTNEIHYSHFRDECEELFRSFEKLYFSFFLRMSKPGREIFEYVIKENNFNKQETIFIDDSPLNIEGARKAGLKTFFYDVNKPMTQLMEL